MKHWFTTYLQLDKDVDSDLYRRNITSQIIQLLVLPFLTILMIGNFIYSATDVVYVNFAILVITLLLFYFPGRERKYDSHIVLHLMALGALLVVYFNQGREFTPIWYFLYIYLVMSLYGHRVGLRISLCFLTVLLSLLFSFTNHTLTMMEFVRFTMVSSFTLFFTYFSEVLIARTFDKFIKTKATLEKLTKTDALTGLFNRRYFDEVLPLQISTANRNDEILALVIIDIDHFKVYNDTYGHPAGDIALVELSKLLKIQMKRGNDAVFRLGGEEFSILYQAKSAESAYALIEDIRIAVESLDQFCHLEQKITISAGLLLIKESQDIAVKEAYEIADRLLYQAKKRGRNNVVMSVFDETNGQQLLFDNL